MRARLVSLSSCEKIIARLSSSSSTSPSTFAKSSSLSESERTRSTTRPSRAEVDSIIVPQAEISTAGVIIAVKTARADERPSKSSNPGVRKKRRKTNHESTRNDTKRRASSCHFVWIRGSSSPLQPGIAPSSLIAIRDHQRAVDIYNRLESVGQPRAVK